MLKEQKEVKVGVVIEFSIQIADDINLEFFYQRDKLPKQYQLNSTATFTLDSRGLIDEEEVTLFALERCEDYVVNQTDIAKFMTGIDHTVRLDDITYITMQ